MKKASTFLIVWLCCLSMQAAVRYVKPATAEAGIWAGQTIYNDLSSAIAAADSGDEIWIAGGLYEIGEGGINYNVAKNLKFYGSFAGTETSIDQRAKVSNGEEWEFTNPTVLKMTVGATCIWINNSSITATFDGLTIDGDNIEGTRGIAANNAVEVFITRCIVRNNNLIAANGGGILGTKKITVNYCLLENNATTKPSSGEKWGGAICILSANSSVKNSTIRNNTHNNNGAGIGIDNVGGVVISDCVLSGNETTTNGGAICGYRIDDIHNCLIKGNKAGNGGGIYFRAFSGSGIAYNCVIVDNEATNGAGGITYQGTTNALKVYNCIIANNKGNSGVNLAGNTANHQMINCLLYNNTTSDNTVVNVKSGGTNNIFKNNILDNATITDLTQTDCIVESDPAKLFADITSADYAAPATDFAGLDKGNADGLSFADNKDYAGNARVQGAAIEIGAYELLPSDVVTLKSLKINGVDIDGFLPGLTDYNVLLDASVTTYPTITVEASVASAIISPMSYNPSVFDSDAVNVLSFTVSNGDKSTDYTISFTVDKMPEISHLILTRIRADKLTRDKDELEAKIDAFLPFYVESDGSFSDCHYVSEGRGDAEVLYHIERLREMGIAYTQAGNKYFEDEAIYNKIVKGLEFWYSKNWTDNNWWYNRIAHPHRLGEMFIAMYGGKKDIRDEAIFTNFVQRWRSSMGDPDSPVDPTTAGTNKCDIAMHWIYRACLTHNEADLAKAADRSFLIVDHTTGEGIQHDWAYRQHGAQLYVGAYGTDFILLVTRQASYLAGTKYALSGDKLDILSQFVRNTYLSAIRGKRMSFSLLGRGVTRKDRTNRSNFVSTLNMLKEVDAAHATEYENAIKRLNGEENANFQASTLQTHYYRGEYTLQQRPEYTFDVRMVSSRMMRSEYDIRENRQGFFLSEGATNILVDGEEYGTILPLWNWKKIPGITMPDLAVMRRADSYLFSGRSPFAGGVTDGLHGVTAFEMINNQELFAYDDDDGYLGTPNNSGTRLPALDFGAKKSWFIFDEEIVCLGAGIYSGHDETVFTTVNQCRQAGEAIVASGSNEQAIAKGVSTHNNVDWVLNDKVAYFFPTKPSLHIANESKTGLWSDINTNHNDAVSGDLFTLWFDHGVRPTNAGYAYIIVPNVQTAAEAKAYQTSNIEILANTDSLQVVYHKELNTYGLAFFKACSFKNDKLFVESSVGCVMMLKDADKDELTVWVADPQKQGQPIKIGIKTPRLNEVKAVTYVNPASPHQGKSLEFTVNNASDKYEGKDVLLSRADWTIIASSEGPEDTAVAPERDVPAYIIDGNTTTSFLFVKPGKTYGGVTVPAAAEVSFTIDMKKACDITYLLYRHRDYNNATTMLRASKGSFYGKNAEGEEFVAIIEDFAIATDVTEIRIDFPEKVAYRYVKFVIKEWYTASGSTIQVSEFNLGNTELPDDIGTGLPLNQTSGGEISLYPNPVKVGESLHIRLSDDFSDASLTVYSLAGTKIAECLAKGNIAELTVNKQGIYIVEAKKNNKTIQIRTIVR